MSGAQIEIDDTQVVNALIRLLRVTSDLTPALNDIGEMLDKSHDARFDLEVSPDGQPWEYLSVLSHLLTKEKNPDKILTESGRLRESLHYDVTDNTLQFGTNVVYAAVHQFGAKKGAFGKNKRGTPLPWGDIPARPFLGVSPGDEKRITDILSDHLAAALS